MDNDFPRNMLVATFKVETDILWIFNLGEVVNL